MSDIAKQPSKVLNNHHGVFVIALIRIIYNFLFSEFRAFGMCLHMLSHLLFVSLPKEVLNVLALFLAYIVHGKICNIFVYPYPFRRRIVNKFSFFNYMFSWNTCQ